MLFRSDRKSTRLNSSHLVISYAVFCLKKKNIGIDHATASDLPLAGPVSPLVATARCGAPARSGPGRAPRLRVFRLVFFLFKATPPPPYPPPPPPPPPPPF